MRREWIVVGLLLAAAGCNREDAECLGRIGNLVGQRLDKLKPATASGPDANAGRSLPSYGGAAEKPESDSPNK